MGGTGGAGWGGAFGAMGNATSEYFDHLRQQEMVATQRQQFNQQQALQQQQLDQNNRRMDMDQFDRLDANIEQMERDLAARGKYLSDPARQAYTNFIQDGRAATQRFWATGDKSGFESWSDRYGPGKAWGTDETGNPITLDTINTEYHTRKPMKDMEDSITSTAGGMMATLASSVMMDPNRTPEMEAWAKGMMEGKFQGNFAAAFAGALSGNTAGPSMLKAGLARTGINGESLAGVEDVLKLLSPEDFTVTDEKGNKTVDPSYAFLTKLIETNRGDIDTFRQGRAIQQGGATVQQFDMNALAYDSAGYGFARTKLTDKRSDVASIGTLISEGDYPTLSSAGGRAEYIRVQQEADPNLNPAEIDTMYNRDVAESQRIYKQKQGMATAQATLLNNSALGSNMDLAQRTAVYEAISPFFKEDALADRNLQAALRTGQMTQAQFLNEVLPNMLRLQNGVEQTGMLRALSEAPGGIGRPALQAARQAGVIDSDTYTALDSYAQDVEGLYRKGVNVQGITLSAEYFNQSVSLATNRAMMQYGVPEATAKLRSGEITALGVEVLNRTLTGRGITPFASRLGSRGSVAQLKAADAQIVTAEVAAEIQRALQKYDIPELQAQGAAQEIATGIAVDLVQQYTAQGAAGPAREVGRSTGMASVLRNHVDINSSRALLRYNVPEGAARAQYQGYVTQIAEGLVNQYIAEGFQPFAQQVGGAQAATQLSTAGRTRLENDVANAMNSARLPFAGQLTEAQVREAIQVSATNTLQQFYNGEVVSAQTPYARGIGALTGQSTQAELGLRLRTLNATIDLLPEQMAAQRQEYATAITTGQTAQALSILTRNNANFESMLGQAGALQGLAGMDPQASLAPQIKNPQVRSMYQRAVKLANDQRDLDAEAQRALNTQRLRERQAAQGGNGQPPLTSQINSLNNTISNFRQQVKAVYDTPQVRGALDALQKTQGVSVSSDPVTGLYKIVVANTDPTVRERANAAKDIIEGASKKAQPLVNQITTLNKQVLGLTSQLAGGQNGGGQAPQPTGGGTVQPGTGARRGSAIDGIGKGDVGGLNNTAVYYTRNGNSVQSNCTSFSRQTTELELGLAPGSLGSGGQGFFQGDATQTIRSFREKNAMIADGLTKQQALAFSKNLKKGDLVFLNYGNPNDDHVAVYDGKGGFLQQSSPGFRGQTVKGDINRMTVEQLINGSGKVNSISFGRINPGGNAVSRPPPLPAG